MGEILISAVGRRGPPVIMPAMRDFFDPPLEQAEFVLVDRATAERALCQVATCEGYSEDADIPFDWVLDRVTGRDQALRFLAVDRRPLGNVCRLFISDFPLHCVHRDQWNCARCNVS